MAFVKHCNSSLSFKSLQSQTSTNHQRFNCSYIGSYDLQIGNSFSQSNGRSAGKIVSFRERPVHSELNQNVGKLEKKEQTFSKRGGAGNIKGQLCKIELAMLCLLHGLKKRTDGKIDGFHLAANMEEAGDFKDVVFKYKYRCLLGKDKITTEKSKIIFFHSMHVNSTEKKITVDVLTSDSKKSLVVNLQKHFSSYRAIKQQFEQKREHPVFGSSFEDTDFVIYTNALPVFNDNENMVKQIGKDFESILHIGGRARSGYFYRLTCDDHIDGIETDDKWDSRIKTNQNIINTLQDSSECRKLVKELVKTVFQCEEGQSPEIRHQGILKKYHIPLSETVIIKSAKGARNGKFSAAFVCGDKSLSQQDRDFRKEFFEEAKRITGRSEIDLETELENKIIKLSDKFGDRDAEYPTVHSLPNDYIHENEIKEFLGKLQFHVGMPDESDLAEIIKEKVKDVFDVDQADIDPIFSDVKAKLGNWWKTENYFLTENNRFFHDSIRISIFFDIKRPVETFTGRRKELEQLHSLIHNVEEITMMSQMTVVTGLGGIGKTELVRRYVYKHSKDYDNNVIWIKAESYGTLVDSFYKVSENVLKIKIENPDGTEKYIGSIVEDVYRYFCKRKCLFIFDNAEKYKSQTDTDPGIDKFLPSFPQNNRTFVLVTSRNQDWGKAKTLSLDVFGKEDAQKFIRDALGLGQGFQEDDIQELSETLHRFPLVLQQVVAYIKEEDKNLANIGKRFSLRGYLDAYKNEGLKLKELDFKLFCGNNYVKTTFITWKITFQKIKAMNYGEEALDILNMLAYFAPDSISTKIFFGEVAEKRILASALQLLKQYSMISVDSGEAKIHRLVQQVIREDLKMQQKEERVLTNAMMILRPLMESGGEMSYDCTSHAMSTWVYVSKYDELVKEFSDVPLDIMLTLGEKGVMHEEACQFIRQASQLLETTIGTNNTDTLLTMNAAAVACGHRGRYDEALNFFQEVHNTLRHVLSSDHPLTLTLQNNVALSLSNKGKYDEAWKLCQEILDKRKKILGDNHPDTLSTLNDGAVILNNQRKYDEALKTFQEVLEQKKQLLAGDDRTTLSIKHDMAVAYYHQKRYDEAFNTYKEVLEEQSKILGPNDPDTLRTKNNMSLILCAKGQYDEALSYCEQLLGEEEQILGPDNVHDFILKLCRALILYEQGNYAEALVSCQELLNQKEKILGPDNPDILQTHDIKAAVLLEQGKYDEALSSYNELLERKSRVFGCNSLFTLQTQNNKATVLAQQGKYGEALLIYKDSLKKYKLLFGSDDYGTLMTEHDIAGVLVDQGYYYEALETYQKLLNKLQDILEPDHVDILILKQNTASVLVELGKYDAALETYAEVLSREKSLDPAHPRTLLTQINMAAVLHKQGKYDEALLDYQELLEVCQQTLTPDHPCNFKILGNMASVLQDKGYYDMALKIHRQILDKRKHNLDSDHPDVLKAEDFIATVLRNQGKYDKACRMFSRVLGKRQKQLGPNHPDSVRSLSNIAELLCTQGRYKESLETYREVLNRLKLTLGEDHPIALATQDDIARVLFNQGKYRDLLNYCHAVLEKKKLILGLEHPSTLSTQGIIGRILLQQGKYSEAHETFSEVLIGREKALRPGHPDALDTLDDIAEVFSKQGYYDRALKAYEEALDKRKRFLGPNHPDILRTEGYVAEVLFKQGFYAKALDVYSEVFKNMEKIMGPLHPCTLQTRNSMATVMDAQENYEGSLKIYDEVLKKKKEVLGPSHPEILNTLSDMARVMSSQKHFDLAMEAHRDILSKRKQILGPDHPETLMTENYIAGIFFKQGNYDMAVNLCSKLLNKTIEVFGPQSPHILCAQKNIAVSLDRAEKYEEALEAYKALLNKSEQILGSDHPDTLSVGDDVAKFLYNLGNCDEALKVSQELLEKKKQRLGCHHPSTLFTMERVIRDRGDTEEYFALIKTCVEVLDKEMILALHNSDPLSTGYLVLHTLCREGDEHVLGHLVENGADIFARNEDHTLLHQAATNNNTAVIKLVLNKIKEKYENITPYIDATDEEGDTPLMWAAETGNVSSARVLLECGANVNAKNKSDQTALHWAAKGGFQDIVELLVESNVDPNIKDINNATALDLACERLEHGTKDEESFTSVVSLLLTLTPETVSPQEVTLSV